MSQAFVKNDADVPEEPVERQPSGRPNYVTPAGLAMLEAKIRELAELRAKLLKAKRTGEQSGLPLRQAEINLRYYETQFKTLEAYATLLAEKDLKLFADIPQDTKITLPDVPEEIAEPAEKKEDLPACLSQRAEYKLLEIGAKAASLQTKMKRGEYLPVIGVGASLYRVDYFKGGDQRFQNSAAFGLVNLPLSSWWEASHSIKEMRLKETAAADRLKERGDSLLVDLEDTQRRRVPG